MGHHVAKQGAHTGKLLAVLSRHLVNQRALAVHHLIVGERQDVVFRESVHHAEGQFVMIVGTVDRVERYVAEDVVHPAHVPLEVKAKASHIRGLGDQRPSRGFLRDHQHIAVLAEDGGIEFL